MPNGTVPFGIVLFASGDGFCGRLLMVAGIGGDGYGLSKIAECKAGDGVGVEGDGGTVVTAFTDALDYWNLSQ